MLTEDQRALNGLLFARRMAERLRREEYNVYFPIPGTTEETKESDPELKRSDSPNIAGERER